jgi:uncharacterized protein (TIGR03083 family)
MSERLAALHASAAHLLGIAEHLDDAALTARAYPADWTIGDVFSHLGSGAVIFTHLFDDVVHERRPVEDFNAGVWTEWNAKHPAAQAADALVADATLLERLDTLDEDRRRSFRLSLGPMELDFEGLVSMRLNEHALHTWDIDVALHPDAVLAPRVAVQVVDNLRMITRFAGASDGVARRIHVRTSNPVRDLVVVVDAESCDLVDGDEGPVRLALRAESFVRLVYGRLDPPHTPSDVIGDALEELRGLFRGV